MMNQMFGNLGGFCDLHVSSANMIKMGFGHAPEEAEYDHRHLLKAIKKVDSKKLYTSTMDNMFIIPNAHRIYYKEFSVVRINSLHGPDSITVEQRQERPSARNN